MVRAGTVVILAAGQGTRMRTPGPKVLLPLCGRPMLGFVLDQARALAPERILIVTGYGGDAVATWVEENEADAPVRFVVQEEQRGTGHAVQVCAEELAGVPGPVVVLYGDMPLLASETLGSLCAERGDAPAAALTAIAVRPRGFGRVVREAGAFRRVVEERDATADELAIREVNVGVYCFDRDALLERLPRLGTGNAQGEYYLTDVLGMLIDEGLAVATVALADEGEAIGINTLGHLAEARAAIQERILARHMENGVMIHDPATTYVDHDVEIGHGTHILPCTMIHAGVRIGEGCEVGPFTHLRPGVVMEDEAEIGNFTEAKQAHIGSGSKAKHLSYLGNVRIGKKANIGAGTIIANYDGKKKHHTEIGDRAFVGSGSILVAPCEVGEGATTGGGAVVTRNKIVPPGESWVGVPARPLRRRGDRKD